MIIVIGFLIVWSLGTGIGFCVGRYTEFDPWSDE